MSNTRGGLVHWWSDWIDVHSIRAKGIQDLETPDGVEDLLDHLRTHFEPIEVFRRERIVDDFVGDFERQPGEEGPRHEIQHFVETLPGSGWTSEFSD